MEGGDLETALRGYVHPGEHILWIGRPQQGLRLSASDGYLIPFSLLWGGFAIFWESSVVVTGAPTFFDLWGVPFVLVGLYMIIGRFFVDAWIRARTVYALTDRRAIVLRRVLSERLNTAPLGGEVRLKGQSDGRGTIEFGPATPMFSRGRAWSSWTPALTDDVAFLGIEDVRRIYGLAQGRT